jgi:hypothetical protein
VGEHVEHVLCRLGEFQQLASCLLCPGLRDGVGESVRQQFVLFGRGLLLEIVGHTRADCVARNRLRTLPGKENKRQVRIPRPDRLQKLDTGLTGHLVVAHDAVDIVVESVQSRLGARRRLHGEPLVETLQNGYRDVEKIRAVVDV